MTKITAMNVAKFSGTLDGTPLTFDAAEIVNGQSIDGKLPAMKVALTVKAGDQTHVLELDAGTLGALAASVGLEKTALGIDKATDVATKIVNKGVAAAKDGILDIIHGKGRNSKGPRNPDQDQQPPAAE